MSKLEGQVALITGGTKGIGRAIAEAFLEEGASVAINGRSAITGELMVAELDAGDRAVFLEGDVTVRADIDRIVDGTVEHFGQLDILVNNAGGLFSFGPVGEITDEQWLAALDLNLNATFRATRRALHHMVPRGYGRIINVSSLEGKTGMPMLSPYVASKHGIHGLTKSVAKEYGRFGITCNSICPGLVPDTEMGRVQGPQMATAMGLTWEEAVQFFAERSALGRTISLAECAGPAVMLASEAGSGISGVNLSIDGGTSEY